MSVVPLPENRPDRPMVPGHLARVLHIADHDPATLTVPELAAYLKLPVGTTYQYLRQGVIPARRAGRRWIISRTRIDRWMDEITEHPEPATPVSTTPQGGPYPWEVR